MLSVMCGRATYKLTWEEIVALYRLTLGQPAVNTRARYNVCPTTTIDAIVGSDGKREAAFQQAVQQLGWSDGRNVRIDVRWGANDIDRDRKYAAELVALAPDVILASGTLSAAALQNVTRTLPIVFAQLAAAVIIGIVVAIVVLIFYHRVWL